MGRVFHIFPECEVGKTDLMRSSREDDTRLRPEPYKYPPPSLIEVHKYRMLIRSLCETLTYRYETLFRSANAIQLILLNLIITIIVALSLLVRWVTCQCDTTFQSSDLEHYHTLDHN